MRSPWPAGSPRTPGSNGQEPPQKRQKGYHQQQQQAAHAKQHTPRYVPGGGGDGSKFSPAPSPSLFSPPPTPRANGRGGGQFAPPVPSWETARSPSPPLPHGANRRQVSYQGSRGVTLSFNYWVGRALSNQVLTSSVRKLVVATLAGEVGPDFVEKVPGANKVVIACVSGLGMAKAEASMAAEECPFLHSCSSVPVRHSLEPGRGRGPPRVLDVQPGAALMMWGEKPTIPAAEISAMSLVEVFRDCEVTFAGIKSPGWKDDVSFHPSRASSEEAIPAPPGLEVAGVSSGQDGEDGRGDRGVTDKCDQADNEQDEGEVMESVKAAQLKQQQQQGTVTCRGKYWRNQNRDSGKYTLVVENDGSAAELTLSWDRWDDEVLVLKETGPNLSFEAKNQSLSLTLSCARYLTDKEKKLSQQGEVASPPIVRVEVVDPTLCPSSPPPVAEGVIGINKIELPHPPSATDVANEDSGASLPGGPDADSSSNHMVVRVPLESLDPEMYCLTSAARYRLGMPVRVSEEGPGYVSTTGEHEPARLSPTPPLGEEQTAARGTKRKGLEGADEEEEEEEEEGQAPGNRRGRDDASGEEEEEGEVGKGDLEDGELGDGGGGGGGGRGEGESANDGEADAMDVSCSSAAEDGAVVRPGGFGDGEEGAGGGGGKQELNAGGESDDGGTWEHRHGGERGRDEQQQDKPFVPPSADRLCPIPSGPREGIVLLGLDCEMVYTKSGLELARVTLVNVKGDTVYDELVKPLVKVTDYNTQFSGITAKMLQGVERTLRDVQREILTFVNADTYLVGHSLESDLRALKLVHRRLIDTSELYPNPRGMPFKNGLRVLSKTVLGRKIQEGDSGHDSNEDAFASLELALLKMHRGPGFEIPPVWAAKPNPPKESLFESLERRDLPGVLRCKVSGDLEAGASAEHPPGTPLWSVFNCGYRREQDAVWAAKRFRENGTGESSQAGTSTTAMQTNGEHPSSSPARAESSPSSSPRGGDLKAESVTVSAAHFPTAGGMLREALASITPGPEGSSESSVPSLMWVDLPCHTDLFDQDDHDKHWSSLLQVDRAVSQLYDKMAEGTLLVVVCQGPLSSMVNLGAKRTKSKWDANSDVPDSFSGSKKMSTFDRQDEDDLVMATSECLNGMCFLASK